ncbi:putative leucine--tRNA ligase, cytoplasmic [Dictyocoela muelleri]|nr:putative leucine--tRNA ligase, cytoplasmic [Dictyocoela muelleri]
MNPEPKKLNFLKKLAHKIKCPKPPLISNKPKYFITFPYPYMNGRLHLGHLFSISKAEFQSRYMELYEYNVFFPFSFHCTGMPISANALKLADELKRENDDNEKNNFDENEKNNPSKVSNILKSMGFTELLPFTDPIYWLKTFPPLCQKDLMNFNINTNWASSFITTEINKFYDSFVKWQFRKLKKNNLIFFGKRYTIYCPKTEQPCLDHDRSVGEGNNPEPVDLLIINSEIVNLNFERIKRIIKKSGKVNSTENNNINNNNLNNNNLNDNKNNDKNNNVFNNTDLNNNKIFLAIPIIDKKQIDYKNLKSLEIITKSTLFKIVFIKEKEIYLILDEIFFRNLKYQSEVEFISDVSYEEIKDLKDDLKDFKDDLKNFKDDLKNFKDDLKNFKDEFQEEFKILFKKVNHNKKYPSFVKFLTKVQFNEIKKNNKIKNINDNKIENINDNNKNGIKGIVNEIKYNDDKTINDLDNKSGINFYAHKSENYLKKISCINNDLNDIEKKSLLKTSKKININENILRIYIPESLTKSRSGSECVVALIDQWFINYNNHELKSKTKKLIEKLKCSEETRKFLIDALNWIDKWGFSRSFGLGSKIPFDDQYLIDSLSDSTIYMAFYTIKKFLFRDFEGEKWIVNPEVVNDEFWDFIFCFTDDYIINDNDGKNDNNKNDNNKNDNCNNDKIDEKLININNLDLEDPDHLEIYNSPNLKTIMEKMKKSFEYFYPVDLRVSGKDLLKNHLIFFLMNHVAIYSEKYWPKRIFTNGHLLLNNEKMSKSTGNYLSAKDCIEKYGSLSTRMALAHSGDFNEDANFQESIANSCILKIYNFIEFINKIMHLRENFENNFEKKRFEKKVFAMINFFNQKNKLKKNIENLNINTNNDDFDNDDFDNNNFNNNKYNKDNNFNNNNFNDNNFNFNNDTEEFETEFKKLSFAEKYFLEGIYFSYVNSILSYESMKYADVLKYGFYEMMHIKETYFNLKGDINSEIMIFYVYFILMIMYPILPICRDLFETFFNEVKVENNNNHENKNIKNDNVNNFNHKNNKVDNDKVDNNNVKKDDFFKWPINIHYNNENLNYSIDELISSLDSLINYKSMEYIKKIMRLITRRMSKNKNSKKVVIMVSNGNPEWKKEIDLKLEEIFNFNDNNIKYNKILIKKIDKKILIKELKPIFLKHKISEGFVMGYVMNGNDGFNINEINVLNELKWYLEYNLNVELEIREDEKVLPGDPNILLK